VKRITVVGVTGSGKSTLARHLAARLGLAWIELDALNWGPRWTMSEDEVFRADVARAVSGCCWVADGNYSKVRDLVWTRADTLVWLDYALPLIFGRLLRRTLRRVISGQELWNGNKERFANQFLSRESLFAWAIQTHPRYRAEFPRALREQAYAHLEVVRLRSPRTTRLWLGSLKRL
jgi:adenylate kinase family enzyme